MKAGMIEVVLDWDDITKAVEVYLNREIFTLHEQVEALVPIDKEEKRYKVIFKEKQVPILRS